MNPDQSDLRAGEPPLTPDGEFLSGPGEPGLVSVVIPTYNREYILGAAIQSVLDQTYSAVEVLVVDDGSRDNTRALVQQFDSRVRYLYQENAGVCAARNLGMANARGEFVALLDSDDRWLPWKLEAQIAVLHRLTEVGMVSTDMIAIDETNQELDPAYLRTFYAAHRKVRIEEVLQHHGSLGQFAPNLPQAVQSGAVLAGDLFPSMILGNLVHTSTVVLRRSRLAQVGGFDLTLKRSGEDYEFHLRTCSIGPVALIDASSILYRVGAADQLTSPEYTIDMARNNLETVQRWMVRGGARVSLPRHELHARLAESYAWLGEQELLTGEVRASRENLWRSVKLDPANPHRLAALACTYLPLPLFLAANRGRKRFRHFVSVLLAAILSP